MPWELLIKTGDFQSLRGTPEKPIVNGKPGNKHVKRAMI